jgi:hypothetical protein
MIRRRNQVHRWIAGSEPELERRNPGDSRVRNPEPSSLEGTPEAPVSSGRPVPLPPSFRFLLALPWIAALGTGLLS